MLTTRYNTRASGDVPPEPGPRPREGARIVSITDHKQIAISDLALTHTRYEASILRNILC